MSYNHWDFDKNVDKWFFTVFIGTFLFFILVICLDGKKLKNK